MLRNSLAALLIGTWINLSGAAPLPGQALATEVGVQGAGKEAPGCVHLSQQPAEFPCLLGIALARITTGAIHWTTDTANLGAPAAKLYKLLEVFLI